MKYLQQCQLIMALVMAINEANIAEMVFHYSGGYSGLNVYGWKPAPNEEYTTENKVYDKTAYIDCEEAAEQLTTIISDLQAMLTNTEAAA